MRQVSGFGSDYRLVLPGRWGYKWVKLIKQIVIVDYNYNGTYEGYGLSGLAKRPNVAMPQTSPPTASYTIVGYENSPPVKVLTNSSVQSFERQGDQLTFRVTGSEGTSGYFYVVISRQVLEEPYDILVDGQSISHVVTTTDDFVYLWVTYSHSSHTIEIEGSLVVSGGSCQSRSVMM